VTVKKREVVIESLRLVGSRRGDLATLSAVVSAGTYIRSLARDIAVRLGTVGHVTRLRRLRDGNCGAELAISMEKILELSHTEHVGGVVIPIEAFLGDIPVYPVSEQCFADLQFGRCIRHSTLHGGVGVACVSFRDEVVAVGRVADGVFFPQRVLSIF
jgi:tRNA pseudouridine55 synthase